MTDVHMASHHYMLWLQELIAMQQNGPKDLGFFGTRNMGFLHQNLIEVLSYAMCLTVRPVVSSKLWAAHKLTSALFRVGCMSCAVSYRLVPFKVRCICLVVAVLQCWPCFNCPTYASMSAAGQSHLYFGSHRNQCSSHQGCLASREA